MITLTVKKAPFEIQPHQKSVVIGPQGGSIGRQSEGNILVVPDPAVSRHHCQILFENGNYYVKDTSSNGVYINQALVPLGNGNVAPIKFGDVIQIGETELQLAPYGQMESDLGGLDPVILGLSAIAPTQAERDMKPAAEESANHLWNQLSEPLPEQNLGVELPVRDDFIDQLMKSTDNPAPEQAAPDYLASFLTSSETGAAQTSAPNLMDQLNIPNGGDSLLIPDDYDPLAPDPDFAAVSRDGSVQQRQTDNHLQSLLSTPTPGESIGSPPPIVSSQKSAPPSQQSASPQPITSPQPAASPQPVSSPHPGAIAGSEKRPQWPSEPSVASQPKSTPISGLQPPESGSSGQSDANLSESLAPLLGERAAAMTDAQQQYVVAELADAMGRTTGRLMELLQSRWAFKQSLRLDMTMIQRSDNNPLKFSPTPDAAFDMMFVHRPKGYLAAPDAFDECIKELHLHQTALIGALKPAIVATVEKFFSAAAIEQLANQSGRAGLAIGKKGRLWDCYTERVQDLLTSKQEELERFFMDQIGTHYDRLSKTLR